MCLRASMQRLGFLLHGAPTKSRRSTGASWSARSRIVNAKPARLKCADGLVGRDGLLHPSHGQTANIRPHRVGSEGLP